MSLGKNLVAEKYQYRKEKYYKAINPPPISETLKQININNEIQHEIEAWKKRIVCFIWQR